MRLMENFFKMKLKFKKQKKYNNNSYKIEDRSQFILTI